MSVARYTSPMPPAPSGVAISYSPSRVPGARLTSCPLVRREVGAFYCFARQHAVLNDDGLILHSFWHGEGENTFNDLRLVYHNEKDLTAMLEDGFDIVALERHAKQAEGDSIYVLARKK